MHFRIVGSGLIGTSIALCLASLGHSVDIDDSDADARKLARDLVGKSLASKEPDMVIVATPPESIFSVLQTEYQRHPQSVFIDVGSVKNKLIREVEGFPELSKRFVGTHPMAGREFSGAASAQSDLFQGRAWIVTRTQNSAPEVLNVVTQLVESLGATVYEMDAESHDQLLARISHLPQALSTVLAGSLMSIGKGMELSGQGLRDTTRLADSDARLWSEIFLQNREAVLQALQDFSFQLERLHTAILKSDVDEIGTIFNQGKQGRSRVSGKHGSMPRDYVHLMIVIKDEPGALKQLFEECAVVNANIEDLSIEHSPKQETGLITLAFSPEEASRVQEHLVARHWKVHAR